MSICSEPKIDDNKDLCSKVTPDHPTDTKVNHGVGSDAIIEDKVKEICGIMFNTLRKNFPLHSDETLIEVASEIMNDINEG